MITPELAASIEDIYNRAIVKGETLMHARASDLLAICGMALKSLEAAGKEAAASDSELAAEVAKLKADLQAATAINDNNREYLKASVAAEAEAKAKLVELDGALAALEAEKAEKARFEALALESAAKNEFLEAQNKEAAATIAARVQETVEQGNALRALEEKNKELEATIAAAPAAVDAAAIEAPLKAEIERLKEKIAKLAA